MAQRLAGVKEIEIDARHCAKHNLNIYISYAAAKAVYAEQFHRI